MDVGISNPLSLVTAGSRSQAGVASSSGSQSEAASPTREAATEQVQQAAESAREPVEQAISSLQGFVQSIRRDLNFDLDDSSGRMVVKVTDSASGDVIRQIPSEDALRLAENLEEIRSLLFKAEA